MTNQHDRDYQIRDKVRIAYSIGCTCERLTSRVGLAVVLRVLQVLGMADWAERLFPPLGSNRGYAGTIIETLILWFCEGAGSLDEMRVLRQEQRLLRWGWLGKIPSSHTLSRFAQTRCCSGAEVAADEPPAHRHGLATAAGHLPDLGHRRLGVPLQEEVSHTHLSRSHRLHPDDRHHRRDSAGGWL